MLGVLQAIISGQQPDMRAVHRLHELIVSGDLNGDVSHTLVLVRQGCESHNAAAEKMLLLLRHGSLLLSCLDCLHPVMQPWAALTIQSLLLCLPDVMIFSLYLSLSLSLSFLFC